jgi:hypothetical protein
MEGALTEQDKLAAVVAKMDASVVARLSDASCFDVVAAIHGAVSASRVEQEAEEVRPDLSNMSLEELLAFSLRRKKNAKTTEKRQRERQHKEQEEGEEEEKGAEEDEEEKEKKHRRDDDANEEKADGRDILPVYYDSTKHSVLVSVKSVKDDGLVVTAKVSTDWRAKERLVFIPAKDVLRLFHPAWKVVSAYFDDNKELPEWLQNTAFTKWRAEWRQQQQQQERHLEHSGRIKKFH